MTRQWLGKSAQTKHLAGYEARDDKRVTEFPHQEQRMVRAQQVSKEEAKAKRDMNHDEDDVVVDHVSIIEWRGIIKREEG
eukprot:4241261-Pyramimonas_sp.AAC.2